MAQRVNKLNARTVATIAKPGRHSEGGGLYLVVEKSGSKRWAFLFRQNSRLREMGLGGLNSVPLAMARQLAADCRKTIARGGDPIAKRNASAHAVPTFGAFADKFLETQGPGWRNEKHRAQWAMTLREYAAPIRRKPVDAIKTEDMLGVLKPIWTAKPETASRLRGRIEQVLDAARAAGHRTGENPARWKEHLQQLLPKRQKLTCGHHAAMPYEKVPAFIDALRDRPSVASLALEFLILTAARSGEALGTTWPEIDLEAKVWVVPSNRMKSHREHRVPLSDRALAVLAEAKKVQTAEFVFPGRRPRRPLSGMAMEMVLRRMKIEDATVHGFRSSFRDWCGDKTTFPREVAEAALAHATGDETERAYRRGDALAKRRELMDAWARFCSASGPGSYDADSHSRPRADVPLVAGQI
jgi:integrase